MTFPTIAPSPTNGESSRHHHGSHRRLLSTASHALQDDVTVDAIIVPTVRPSIYLQHAIDLSARLGCALVALCSRGASVQETIQRASSAEIESAAINTTILPANLMPAFATSDLLANSPFERRSDLSLKRNLGLLLARLAGWKRIVFLDDDITVPRPDDLRDAVSMLTVYEGVGLSIGGFPDNSVVCHAYREIGGAQDTFVGGGALAVEATSTTSFFPNIYNEDWFFLLNNVRLRPTALTGLVTQAPYDPFANEMRARAEEFGDTLAEGVYWLLDHGRRVQDADTEYWHRFLRKRREFINDIIVRIPHGLPERCRMVTALRAALGRSERITPQLCVDFLRAWRIDQSRWHRHIETRGQVQLRLDKVLAELGLMGSSAYTITNERTKARRAARTTRSRRRRAS